MALKQIKNKIKSTQRTSKVTKAMEAVSAVKMRKSQEKALKGRAYAEAALRILENISGSQGVRDHSFFTSDKGEKSCLIVVTSDKGLAGSLNSAVLKEATLIVKGEDKRNIEIIAFGKKAYEHFLRREFTIPKHYINVSDDIEIDDMEEVVTLVTKKFSEGTYRKVHVVYQNFISTFEQKAVVHQLLPISTAEIKSMIQDILPRHGKYSEDKISVKTVPTYTVEQSSESLLDSILSKLVEIMLYHSLLESKASEHSARMVAMKNATDKAKEVIKMLTILFNKERQSVITAEVSEITGGIEALKNR